MEKTTRRFFLFTILATAILGALYGAACFVPWFWESADLAKYQRIQDGMSILEVQAILGPGTPVVQADVSTYVVPANPKDAEAAEERARRSGWAPLTAREYPTRHQYVVEGDFILHWKPSGPGVPYGCQIYVAFRDGKVCGKYYADLNYL